VHVLSIHVGRPRALLWHERPVRTSIWKSPVSGRIHVGALNLAGDEQSDLTVHGGRDKAVYAYPSEHYAFWARELDMPGLSPAAFGENLSLSGVDEADVRIGDRFRIGTAEFTVTQPRLPCFKLGIRFGRDDVVERFAETPRSGFYMAVVLEGDIEAGDVVTVVQRDRHGVTVADVASLRQAGPLDLDLLRRASELTMLAAPWRDHFKRRLHALEAEP
jgi:MOSC domain-containing protein YiiM